jgi:hypothetical protein
MRYATNCFGRHDVETPFHVLQFSQDLYREFVFIDDFGMKHFSKKLEVFLQNVVKIESGKFLMSFAAFFRAFADVLMC